MSNMLGFHFLSLKNRTSEIMLANFQENYTHTNVHEYIEYIYSYINICAHTFVYTHVHMKIIYILYRVHLGSAVIV